MSLQAQAAARASTARETGELTAAWTVQALRSVWAHQRGRVNERIGVIDRALQALANDRLDRELRMQALRAAHMLTGSLGMFGFVDASTAAGQLELELERACADRVPRLLELLERVRNGVQGPVVLCSETAVE